MTITLAHFLAVAAVLFGLGLYTVLTRRNAVAILMGIELILNAGILNLVAFGRSAGPAMDGQVFALFSIALAAAEAGIGFAILISLYRLYGTIDLDNIRAMRW